MSRPGAAQGPLRRNRDFLLLQLGQLLSGAGTQLTTIAYPLLTLAVTGSAGLAGFVGFARALPAALLSLPAGLAADRLDRRRLMIAADLVRAVAVGALAGATTIGAGVVWVIPAAAFVEGCGAAVFSAAAAGALRAVVDPTSLPAAVATQTGRQAVVQLLGPPAGGVLFAAARMLPFLVDAASYLLSTASLLALRTPFQQPRPAETGPLRDQLAEGFRFLWQHRFLRTCALIFGLGNLLGPGLLFALVVIAHDEGLSAARIGALAALFAAGLLIGSLLSPVVRRALTPRAVLMLELWMWPACGLYLIRPNVYLLALGLLPAALAIPSTDSVVHGYRIAITPDHLLGRSEAVRTTASLLVAPLGPLIAGALLERTTPAVTVAVFFAGTLGMAAWGRLSRDLRQPPEAPRSPTRS